MKPKSKSKSPTPKASLIPAQGNALGSSPAAPAKPVGVAHPSPLVIPDQVINDLEHLINCCIHELVFALHYLTNDDHESSMDCLTTVGLNVDCIQEQILAYQKAATKTQEAA